MIQRSLVRSEHVPDSILKELYRGLYFWEKENYLYFVSRYCYWMFIVIKIFFTFLRMSALSRWHPCFFLPMISLFFVDRDILTFVYGVLWTWKNQNFMCTLSYYYFQAYIFLQLNIIFGFLLFWYSTYLSSLIHVIYLWYFVMHIQKV